jgi:hypothetical protein
MQRIPTLIQKISELSQKGDHHLIEIDLMLDYTRVLYADLMEMRNRIAFNESLKPTVTESAPIKDNVETVSTPEEPVEEESQTIPEPLPVTANNTGKDIRSFIAVNDKYQFISELFSNDKDRYNEVLDEINKTGTYPEAEEWLRSDLAVQQGWNNDNMTVQMFYSTVSQFFSAI